MSLDYLDLSLDIEERFDVSLDRERLQSAKTFGDILDMLIDRIQETPIPPETEQRSEEQEYRATLEELKTELQTLVPNCGDLSETTKLAKIIRFGQRYRIWTALRTRFPVLPLENPTQNRKMFTWLTYMGPVTFAAVILSGIKMFEWGKWIFAVSMIILFAMFFGGAIYFIAQYFSSPYKTVGDLADEIAQRRCRNARFRQANREEIAEMLREIFRKVLALDAKNEIRFDSRLREDLGVE